MPKKNPKKPKKTKKITLFTHNYSLYFSNYRNFKTIIIIVQQILWEKMNKLQLYDDRRKFSILFRYHLNLDVKWSLMDNIILIWNLTS